MGCICGWKCRDQDAAGHPGEVRSAQAPPRGGLDRTPGGTRRPRPGNQRDTSLGSGPCPLPVSDKRQDDHRGGRQRSGQGAWQPGRRTEQRWCPGPGRAYPAPFSAMLPVLSLHMRDPCPASAPPKIPLWSHAFARGGLSAVPSVRGPPPLWLSFSRPWGFAL